MFIQAISENRPMLGSVFVGYIVTLQALIVMYTTDKSKIGTGFKLEGLGLLFSLALNKTST